MVKYDKFSKKQSELEDDYVDELTQELFLHLSEMKYDKLIDLHSNQYLFFHCIRFLNNQFNSKNSKFYRQIKRNILKKNNNAIPIEKLESFNIEEQNDELNYILKIIHVNKKISIINNIIAEWSNIQRKDTKQIELYMEQTFMHHNIVERKTQREIAKMYKIPLTTINSILKKAISILKNKVNEKLKEK